MSGDPENVVLDPLYVYPIVAGIIAYLLGRSRRSAFIAVSYTHLDVYKRQLLKLDYPYLHRRIAGHNKLHAPA